jgi:predicted Zn-dependent protease
VLVVGLLWFILSYNNQEAIQLTESPPSTAILPLDNSAGGPAQQYFSDGNTADLITALVVKGEGEFTARRYTEAISTLENALELEPAHQKTLLLLAASYAQTDRNEDASWTIVQLLMLHPEVSRSRLHSTFSFQDHSQLQHLLDGLEKAGLPE